MPHVNYAALSDTGRVRKHNEDNWFAKPELGLFGVADGMGGRAAGQLASQIVAEALPRMLAETLRESRNLTGQSFQDKVRAKFSELSKQVRQESAGKPGLDHMGATVVSAVVQNGSALIVHMGDSRAYLWRGGRLQLLTRDHTLVQYLVENEAITLEQARSHPARSQVTRYVGMDDEAQADARCIDVAAGDRLLLCSDGLTSMVADEQLSETLSVDSSLSDTCQSLIDAANEAGGEDNITVLLLGVS